MNDDKTTFDDFHITFKKLFSKRILNTSISQSSKSIGELDAVFNNLPVAICIFDHSKLKYIYCNENISSLMGYPREIFTSEDGLQKVFNTFHPKHSEIYNNYIYPKAIEIFSECIRNNEDVKSYKFCSTFKAIRSSGQEFWCHLQFNVIEIDSDGVPLLTLSLMSDISHIKKDNTIDFLIFKTISNEIQQTISYTCFSENNTQYKFTKREIEILNLIKKGFSSKNIAEKLFLSPNTISTHRKSILSKSNCKNMVELITFATTKNII